MEKRTKVKVLAARVLAVAIEGSAGDWSAYIDAVPGEHHDSEWWAVRDNGAKLSRELAEFLFPEFKDLEWRD